MIETKNNKWAAMNSEKHNFDSHGLLCEGVLHLPDNVESPPVVVMGHGYGAEISFGTCHQLDRFIASGFAVFMFNYRFFAGSEGHPRQIIDPALQCEDWLSAIAKVRSIQGLDTSKIALWGSSFGGGHVLSTAAVDHDIKAVVAQVPHCDSRSAFKQAGISTALRALAHGLFDSILSIWGSEHRVAILGQGQGMSVMNHAGWYESYLALTGHSKTWKNTTPARSLLKAGNYNPIDTADQITCPVFIVYATSDQGVPTDDVLRTAEKIANCECYDYEGDHFDLYDGGPVNYEVTEAQCQFLIRELKAS